MQLGDYLEELAPDEEAERRKLAEQKSYEILDYLDGFEDRFSAVSRSDTWYGSTSPSIFVGRSNYPSVPTGILTPVGEEDRAADFKTSSQWYQRGLDIEHVLQYRTGLLNANRTADVRVHDAWDGFVGVQREVALADRPVDVEVGLSERPELDVRVDDITTPTGPRARADGMPACAYVTPRTRTWSAPIQGSTSSSSKSATASAPIDRCRCYHACMTHDPLEVGLIVVGDEPLIERAVEGLTVTAVNTGVPHAVAFVDDVDAVDLEAIAPPVRHAAVFLEGANVTLAARDELDDDAREGAPGAPAAFRQRTFQRGVEGETLACGTGAVAVVAAAKRTGRLDADGPVRVSPPGGDLVIVVPDDGPATLTGPVEREFEVELEVPA
jgi:hypothetical protein